MDRLQRLANYEASQVHLPFKWSLDRLECIKLVSEKNFKLRTTRIDQLLSHDSNTRFHFTLAFSSMLASKETYLHKAMLRNL